ncbi:TolC family protein [candidate division KSB1 bacterium]
MKFKKTAVFLLVVPVIMFFLQVQTYGQVRLTLDRAVELAMSNSPDIKRTRLDLERNRELLKAQQAANKSNFSLTVNPFSYSKDLAFNKNLSAWISGETKESISTFRISQPIKYTGGTVSLINRLSWQDSYSDYQDVRNKQYSNNLYLSFSQPIFTHNEIKLEMKELELDLEKTQLTYAIQELQIERLVAQYFYRVYENKLNVDIAAEELKNQETSYDIIKKKVEAEITAKEELYQAELNLLSSQSSVQNAKVTLENSYDDLKQLIGLPLTDGISVDADTSFKVIEVSLTKAIESGLQNRRELEQYQIDIENAQIDLIRTAARNEFKGTVSLTYGLVGTHEQLGDVYDKANKNQSIGLSIEIPLFDWGEKKSRIKASEATIKRQQLTYDDEITNINIEIRKTFRQLKNLELQIEIARQNVRNAQLTFEINLERYEYGDLTSMDLSLFQAQLSQKKTQFIAALVDYKLVLLDLKVQSLFDFVNNVPVFQDIERK